MLPRPRCFAGPAVLAVLLSLPFASPVRAQRLTASEAIRLDELLRERLFDPRGAERVQIMAAIHTVTADFEILPRGGWLVRGKEGEPDRVYFTDGEWTAVDPDMDMEVTPVDFRKTCRTAYTSKRFSDKFEEARVLLADGVIRNGSEDLVNAAWLHRLGDDHLAALALAESRHWSGDPVAKMREDLAWWAFDSLVHAYMVRFDEEALEHGERLLRLYPEEAARIGQGAWIVDELRRRKLHGTFDTDPPPRPDGFAAWETKRKIAWLIAALDEVAVLQDGSPGGVDLASDPVVQDLIGLGDAAVPDLLDALENDGRLTRSVHYWREFVTGRTVLGVREAALTALMSILRIQAFSPSVTGDDFTSRGEEAGRQTAGRLRAYWASHGAFPLDERMMRTLADPGAGFPARSEAAANLAHLAEPRNLRTTIEPTVIGPRPERPPNPAIAKFSNPTVAEAILAALDSDLESSPETGRRQVADAYLAALVDLGDPRIASELARRAVVASTPDERRMWAGAAHLLGQPE